MSDARQVVKAVTTNVKPNETTEERFPARAPCFACRSMLILRNVFWTILLPGTVLGYIPYRSLSGRVSLWPDSWAVDQVVGLPLTAVGLSVLLRCIWEFATAGRGTLSPLDPPREFVVSGLYRYVRNPMYVGDLTVLLGEALFFESWELVRYALVMLVIFHLFVMLYEEPTLRRKFGASYDEYCRGVRRWLPGRAYTRGRQSHPA